MHVKHRPIHTYLHMYVLDIYKVIKKEVRPHLREAVTQSSFLHAVSQRMELRAMQI